MRDPKRPTSETFEQDPEILALVEEVATVSKRQVSAGLWPEP